MTESFVGRVAVSSRRPARARATPCAPTAPARRGSTPIRAEFDPGITIPNSGWNAPVADLVTYLAFLTHADHGDTAPSRAATTASCATRRSRRCGGRWCRSRRAAASTRRSASRSTSTAGGDRTIVGHTGEQSGFRSFFYLDPASTTAVIGVLNTTNEARPEASTGGLGRAHARGPWSWWRRERAAGTAPAATTSGSRGPGSGRRSRRPRRCSSCSPATAPAPDAPDRPGRVHLVVVVTRAVTATVRRRQGAVLIARFWHPSLRRWSETLVRVAGARPAPVRGRERLGAAPAAGAGRPARLRADLRGAARGLQPAEHRGDAAGRRTLRPRTWPT